MNKKSNLLKLNPQDNVSFPPLPAFCAPLPAPCSLLPAISIRNLSCAYQSRNLFGKNIVKPVLNNINMDIFPREIIGLTGKSGCGKTTLARCILGLTGYQGEIFIEGALRHYRSRQNHGRPPQVQMIFQDPGTSLNPVLQIGRLMEEPLVIHKFGTAGQRMRKIDETLTRVGLDSSYKVRRAHELSGGQKQRICIGRAIILNPKVLIADEAVSLLDVSAGAHILNLFSELRLSLGLTVLFISHNLDAAEYLCDRIVVLNP